LTAASGTFWHGTVGGYTAIYGIYEDGMTALLFTDQAINQTNVGGGNVDITRLIWSMTAISAGSYYNRPGHYISKVMFAASATAGGAGNWVWSNAVAFGYQF
jgi:hypothetical protein